MDLLATSAAQCCKMVVYAEPVAQLERIMIFSQGFMVTSVNYNTLNNLTTSLFHITAFNFLHTP